eukprot:jgi/Ulvmu1/4097/UM019_0076.1
MASGAQAPSAKARLTGLLLIIVVAVIWVCASFVVQQLKLHPFLITYFCNALFLVYLPISFIQDKACSRTPQQTTREEDDKPADGELQPLRVESDVAVPEPSLTWFAQQPAILTGWLSPHAWTIMKAASAVAPVWFMAQLCFNTSLHMTSVTSNTILSSPSSLFTYFLSILVLHEKFTYSKLGGVLLTVAGTVLVALADRIEDHQDSADEGALGTAVLGDALTLCAAALYAVYTVLIKIMMPDDSESGMMAFFGYLGLINTILFLPIVVILQLAGAINLWMIPMATISVVIVKGLFDNTLSDYLWSRAVLLVGPTIATVGLQLQVPMVMATDPLLHEQGWWSQWNAAVLEVGGAAAILVGFFTINFNS